MEVTLDMAATMENIARFGFPNARLVTDRFHVQKLAYDALQEMRIHYRWEAIDQENKEIELGKETGQKYIPQILENGDTLKQLLARSRYLLFKSAEKWSPSQKARAIAYSVLLFYFSASKCLDRNILGWWLWIGTHLKKTGRFKT